MAVRALVKTWLEGFPKSSVIRYKKQGVERINIANTLYKDQYDKHRTLIDLEGTSIASNIKPRLTTEIANTSFIAPSATVAGNVELWDNSSIWYGCIVKADVNLIRIGVFTNIQDNTVISEAKEPLSDLHDGSTIIGHHVTIGHGCHLTACTIEDECLVGMGSILQEGSYMEKFSMLGAGSVLPKGARVQTGELWVGNPAKFFRYLTDEEVHSFRKQARAYYETAHTHDDQFLPHGTLYIEAEKQGIKVGWQGWLEVNAGFRWDPRVYDTHSKKDNEQDVIFQ